MFKDKESNDAVLKLAAEHPNICRVENGEVWLHPDLFIPFVKWLDPSLEEEAKKLYEEMKMCSEHEKGANNEN